LRNAGQSRSGVAKCDGDVALFGVPSLSAFDKMLDIINSRSIPPPRYG